MSQEEQSSAPPISAVLYAISKHIATKCSKQNKAFADCKQRDANPELCLEQGDAVTSCVVDLYEPYSLAGFSAVRETVTSCKLTYQCFQYFAGSKT